MRKLLYSIGSVGGLFAFFYTVFSTLGCLNTPLSISIKMTLGVAFAFVTVLCSIKLLNDFDPYD